MKYNSYYYCCVRLEVLFKTNSRSRKQTLFANMRRAVCQRQLSFIVFKPSDLLAARSAKLENCNFVRL